MAKRKDPRKGGFGDKVQRVFKTPDGKQVGNEKNLAKFPSASRYHINVLNSKLNDAMAKISSLEWEKSNLERKVNAMGANMKKLSQNLNFYKSRLANHNEDIKAMQEQFKADIAKKDREIKKLQIKHESTILDKEKKISDQDEEISKKARLIDQMREDIKKSELRVDEKTMENLSVVKESLLLNVLTCYEDLEKAVDNNPSKDITDKNEAMISRIEGLIENQKENSEDIADSVLITQLHDVLNHLKQVSDYSIVNEEYKKEVKAANDEFRDLFDFEKITVIPTDGEMFNPILHESVITENNENVRDGYVIEEISKGYSRGDKVLKRAQVKVCKK